MKVISLPPFTRVCVASVVLLSLGTVLAKYRIYDNQTGIPNDDGSTPAKISFNSIKVPILTLVPSLSVPFPWVLLLTSFVEESIWGFFVSVITLGLAGRYCERVWGGRQLAIFLALVSVIPNILSVITLYFWFAATRNEQFILETISGGLGIEAGFLVTLKQLIPEHAIVLFKGAVRIQVKQLIIPAISAASIIGLILGNFSSVLLPWYGFIVSWVYLRFYRKTQIESVLPTSRSNSTSESAEDSSNGSGGGVMGPVSTIRGDASDTFAFSDFFYPEAIRSIVSAISDVVFSFLVAIKVCTPFQEDQIEASNLQASWRTRGRNSISGSVSEADADRRRALALRVLEERLDRK